MPVGASIRIEGLKETIRDLKKVNPEVAKVIRGDFRDAGDIVLSSARSYASGLGGSGQYASSLSMRSLAYGVRIQSGDPGAGTIEFAHPGARYLSGTRQGLRVGVPAGGPPRALVKSSEENEARVVALIESRVERAIGKAGF